jgi:thiamine-phosphate pyrophosphorylase
MSRVPRLVLVTDRHATLGRPLLDVVAAALSGIAATGLDAADVAVQLREKDLEARALTELAWGLRALTAEVGAQLYVNDRADIAVAVRADGVQLAGTSLPVTDVARFAPGLALAVSTHGVSEVAAAQAEAEANPDVRIAFAMFGPIRDTPSKRRYGEPVGLPALAAASKIGVPLVAIGGIESDHVAPALAAGARGVACIRAIMSARDPAATVGTFCRYLADLRVSAPPGRGQQT